MSSLSFIRYNHFQPLRFCRCYASVRATTPRERPEAPSNRRGWYALGVAVVSGLGFWAWTANKSQQDALGPLSPDYFIPAVLTSSEKTNKNAKLLRLTVPPEAVAKTPRSYFKPIWSIYVKDSDIQVERPYTPLEGIPEEGGMAFWVKKYEHGEVGRWLHRRIPGEKIEIRGPEQTWEWEEGVWDNVIMVAGGTGIAPFYQLLHTLFSDPTKRPKTKFTLLQSYCSPKELPPPMILKSFSLWENGNPRSLEVRTFVDSRDGESQEDSLIVRRINEDDLRLALKKSSGRTIVLVCGPCPMISAIAGPKGRNESQGHLGGVLGSLYDGTFQVWKL